MQVGRSNGADIAVVPWKVTNALYQDSYFSVVRITPEQDQAAPRLHGKIASETRPRKSVKASGRSHQRKFHNK